MLKNISKIEKILNHQQHLHFNIPYGDDDYYSDYRDARDRADKAEEKLIDDSKCPKCQSRDLTEIAEDEFKQLNNKSNPTSNPIEEIKKYKELLDMGILTQEEFDTKKRQLLGL